MKKKKFLQFVAKALSMVLVCGSVISVNAAEIQGASDMRIVSFVQQEEKSFSVIAGMSYEEICQELEECFPTVTAQVEKEGVKISEQVPVTWECKDFGNGRGSEFTFVAVPKEGIVESGVENVSLKVNYDYHAPVMFAANGTAPVLNVVDSVSDEVAMQLAKSLVGEGVEITGATMYGTAGAFGSFADAEEIIGFSNGLALSTGLLKLEDLNQNIFTSGYQTFYSTSNNEGLVTGDLLNGFEENNSYYDIAMLEFKYIPEGSNVSFQYVMASEEYPDFISSFFDQFVLMINGVNYALVPGTELPVTIGNVNHLQNTLFYRGVDTDHNPEDAVSGTNFVFNGMTTTFSVSAKVNPGEENTIRIAIADMRDDIYDSAVFIKAGSVLEKPATPGKIEAGTIDEGSLTLHRINGDNGYVSADVVFLGADKSVISTVPAVFADGNTTVKISIPENAEYFYVVSASGGVEIDSAIAQEQTLADYKKVYSITGNVVGMKGTTVIEGDVSGGDVSGGDAAPDTAIYVTLTGDGVDKTVVADENGSFVFDTLAPGFYNIAAKQGNATMSKLVEIVKGGSKTVQCVLDGSEYVYNGSSKVDLAGGDAKVMVGSLENLLKAGSSILTGLTDEELEALNGGGSLDLSFQSAVANPESENAKKLKQYAKDNGMGTINIKLLEFGIQKKVTDKNGKPVSSGAVSDTGAVIKIIIPLKNIEKGNSGYVIYRMHDGKIDVITVDADAQGEKIVIGKDYIELYASKFSTYALTWKENWENPDQSEEPGTTPEPGTSGTSNSPATVTDYFGKNIQSVIQAIVAAEKGSTVRIVTKDSVTLTSSVLETLINNPTISLYLEYTYNGEDYKVLIPAGKAFVVEGIEYYGPLYLYSLFPYDGQEANANTLEYTIVKGDTLARIAKRYNTTVSELVKLNMIKNPNQIRAGQKIVLPAK